MDQQNLVKALLGQKIIQSQKFDEKGQRIPVTHLLVGPCVVVQVKTRENDGYNGLQLGLGIKKEKNTTKAVLKHVKKAGISQTPRFLKEIRVNTDNKINFKPGELIRVSDVFKTGDIVDVTGISRGKGFTGVVKRHHFKGGPRTHGQSDRERAPGSIGQTTTPGRVYKGKRMAGRSGTEQVSVKNLKVIEINNEQNLLIIKGLVPGIRNSFLTISKV